MTSPDRPARGGGCHWCLAVVGRDPRCVGGPLVSCAPPPSRTVTTPVKSGASPLQAWNACQSTPVTAVSLLAPVKRAEEPRLGVTQLATEAVIAVNAILISGVMTIIIALALKYTMGWRIPEEHEVQGVDLTTHGEAAYDLEPSSGSGASGVLTGHTQKAQEVKA
jgi:Ammonium Transporter Family